MLVFIFDIRSHLFLVQHQEQFALYRGLNAILPKTVAVNRILVCIGFSCGKAATHKLYEYHFYQNTEDPFVFLLLDY